ncbi:MAG TPA: hypothetical protein VFI02_00810 [Armatimonadota bacterium]|nr:hypothetical protein [Armatimonadota bacterium]
MGRECMRCGEPIFWRKGVGWVHEGGGLYAMICPQCGWKGTPYPPVTRCPNCQSRDVRDDHCVLPGDSHIAGYRA